MNEQVEKVAETLIYGEPRWVYAVRWIQLPCELGQTEKNTRAAIFKKEPRTEVSPEELWEIVDKISSDKEIKRAVYLLEPGPAEQCWQLKANE